MTSTQASRPFCSRRSFFLALGGAGATALAAAALARRPGGKPATPAAALQLCQRTSVALGSDIKMTVLHPDAAAGEKALDAAFAELRRVEQAMSLYLPESDLSRLNRTGKLADADPYLLEVLASSRDMAERSAGAFDVTVQPLWSLYAAAQKSGRLPSAAEIDAARARVDWRRIEVTGRTIRLLDRGMALTLNGIAQGFAADRAVAALRRHGVEHALVNTGELASIGEKSAGTPWAVGIQHPRQPDAYLGLAKLDGRCLSTSGDYETTFSGDKSQNHIFDPSTGRSPQAFSSVTVVAANATDADALSTAIFVLGPEKGRELAQEFGADVLLVGKDARQWSTRTFPWST